MTPDPDTQQNSRPLWHTAVPAAVASSAILYVGVAFVGLYQLVHFLLWPSDLPFDLLVAAWAGVTVLAGFISAALVCVALHALHYSREWAHLAAAIACGLGPVFAALVFAATTAWPQVRDLKTLFSGWTGLVLTPSLMIVVGHAYVRFWLRWMDRSNR